MVILQPQIGAAAMIRGAAAVIDVAAGRGVEAVIGDAAAVVDDAAAANWCCRRN